MIWPDELPRVLWAYMTIVRTPIGETTFKLVYGNDAVILTEVELISFRVAHCCDLNNAPKCKIVAK